MRSRATAVAAAIAAAMMTLAACGDSGDTETVTVGAGEPRSGQTDGGAAPSAPTPEPEAGEQPAGAGDVLATQTVRAPGSKDGRVTVAIVGLQAQGRLMRLELAFTPRFPSASPDEDISLYNMHGDDGPGVTLVDPVNLKRYVVVTDSESNALEPDNVGTSATNGGTVTGTWTFAAPPADVAKLDVQVGTWPPFTDVAVQR